MAAMEVLTPSPPPSPAVDRFGGAASPTALRIFLQRRREGMRVGPNSGRPSPVDEKLYVAVGRSPGKTLSLLRWAFRRFSCKEIGLLHVHQPSPVIPTLLGKIPANQANEEVVSSFRRTEREVTRKILQEHFNYCEKAQVRASVIVTESDQIHNGIVDMVAQHGITRLVMGATAENCFALKSSKSAFAAKNAPPFCEIWFVSKGRHVWTREPTEATETFLSAFSHEKQGSRITEQDESNEVFIWNPESSLQMISCNSQEPTNLPDTGSWPSSPSESQGELEVEELYDQLREVTSEIEISKKAAFAELVKRRQVESEVVEASNRVKAFVAAKEEEIRILKELQDELESVKLQQNELLDLRNKSMDELENVMEKIAILNSHIREAALGRHEAIAELEFIKSSNEVLKSERGKIDMHGHKLEEQPDKLKFSFHDDSYSLREFTLSDLQAATFEFSDSFKLWEGGYGCMYKGELLNRTIMIRKLHPHNLRGQMEFQQEVHVLSKLHHPQLLNLVGICPEVFSLVYEYMPNGTLQDHMLCRTTTQLTWRIRALIIAEISSALLFLHCSKIVHGNLKLESIFLDSKFNCKIGFFSVYGLPGKAEGLSSLFCDRQGSLPYADPEYERLKELKTKSDIYSLGMIIFQLLTGKPPIEGLVNDVRRRILSGNLSSILDSTAGEWPGKVARSLAEFGLQFCETNIRDRPELTPEVVKELKQLHLIKERSVPSCFLCPILQEIMHDPQVAADGFTYELKALREWFDSGRDTSPMTNLKLKHINLTPNHALRFAVQDWLCQP